MRSTIWALLTILVTVAMLMFVRNIDVCQKICAGRMDGMNSNKNTPFKSCNVFIFESLSTDVHDQVWTVGHCTGEVEWWLVRK